MSIKTLEGINVLNPIKGYENYLVDVFTCFYGEKYKDLIKERFDSITFIFTKKEYQSTDDLVASFFFHDALQLVNEFYKKLLNKEFTIRYLVPDRLEEVYNCLKSKQDMTGEQEMAFLELVSLLAGKIDASLDFSTGEGEKTIKICGDWLQDLDNNKLLIKVLKDGISIWKNEYKEKYQILADKANDEYINMMNQLTHIDFYKQALSKLKSLKIANISDAYEFALFKYVFEEENWQAMCTPYLDEEKVKNICILPLMFNLSKGDFIHEINHALSTSYLEETEDNIKIKIGFTINCFSKTLEVDEKDNNINIVEGTDRYDLFNEIVNDFMTEKIISLMDDLPFFYKGTNFTNTYNIATRLLSNFLEKHLDALKEQNIKSDFNYFATYYGNDDFEKLIDLVNKLDTLDLDYKAVYERLQNEELEDILRDIGKDYLNIKDEIYKLDNIRDIKKGR